MLLQDAAEILSNVLERVKSLDPVNSRAWFDDLMLLGFDGGLMEVGCADRVKVRFLRDNCTAVFARAAQDVTGHLVGVEFAVGSSVVPGDEVDSSAETVGLHPDYTFDSFVVGPCNRLAHASCVAISHGPGTTYNPLFLYGNVGLGKTHLLHAVCHEAMTKTPGASVRFISCEQFVNDFISAIEKGNIAEFQGRLRSVDFLIIDDVQFLREREQSQEEFFHTFNALYNNHRQIILTADCAPGQLPSLEERLVSRFKWGLVARLDAPSYETRIAIVQKKAHLRGLDISDSIAEYIAGKATANIRELEGALTVIYATARTSDKPITLELAKKALGEQNIIEQRHVTITDILDAVTRYFDVRLTDLQSKKRSQSITLPRQVCMYLARNLTRHSLEEIGGHLGGRDHSTVLHACNKIEQLKKTDPSTRAQITELTETIGL